jgi:hypothetical protein
MGCDYPGLSHETTARLEELIKEVEADIEQDPPEFEINDDPEEKAVRKIKGAKRAGVSVREYTARSRRLEQLMEKHGVIYIGSLVRKLAEEQPWDSVEYIAKAIGLTEEGAEFFLNIYRKVDTYGLRDKNSFFRYNGQLSDGSKIHPAFEIIAEYLDRKLTSENELILCQHLQECDGCLKQLAYEVIWRKKFPDKQGDVEARLMYRSYVIVSMFEDAVREIGDKEDTEE